MSGPILNLPSPRPSPIGWERENGRQSWGGGHGFINSHA